MTARDACFRSSPAALVHRPHPALLTLLRAAESAHELQSEPWQFAVDIHTLHKEGLEDDEIRWLIGKHFLDHRLERLPAKAHRRCFSTCAPLVFRQRSCFVLTALGVATVRQARERSPRAEPSDPDAPVVPFWDRDNRQLWWGSRLLGEFGKQAHVVEGLLSALEDAGWPRHLDDPLPRQPGRNTKARLRNAVKRLNHRLPEGTLRFHCDGTGRGVRWEFCPKK